MNAIVSYLLQMACWLAGFWLVYALVLAKETFFELNRWFLLIGLVVSIVLPLFPLHYSVEMVPHTNLPIVDLVAQSAYQQPTGLSGIDYWLLAYVLGIVLFVLRFFWQTTQLIRMQKRGELLKMGTLKIFKLDNDTAPFSFFTNVYVSEKLSGETEFKAVIAHEKVHIDERHWADLLLLEVVRALQWFNPLLIIYRKAIMQNHEYLADRGTLKNGVCARTYQSILVNQMLGVPVLHIANGFTLFNPTKRITMMNKHKTLSAKRLNLLWALPVAALIMVAFAKPVYVMAGANPANVVGQDNVITVKGKVTNPKGDNLPGASVIVAGTHIGTLVDSKGEFTLEGIKPDAEVVISFVGFENCLFKAQENIEVQMKRKVVKIDVVNIASGEMTPLPPPFQIKYDEIDKKPLVVVDGEISVADINKIDSESIESLEVLKNQSATELYGDKAKDGVILITTKKINPQVAEDEVFVVVEDMPSFKGGEIALNNYIIKATANSKEKGEVDVQFTVAADGSIKDVVVIKTPSKFLSKQAIKIVNAMPVWNPGKQRGKSVTVDMMISLNF